MRLELKLFATFRAIVGSKTVEREFPDDTTVGDVLSALEAEYPDMADRLLDDDGAIQPQLSVLKNGREVIHLDGTATPMDDGDTLSVFPPVAGGAEDVEEGLLRQEKAFRGISKRLAVHYLENLGGELVAGEREDNAEATVRADDWTATLSAEKVSIAGSMKLTEVSVAFEAEEGALEGLVEKFTQKAMRAGG